ncbi:HEPN domain-containing protein [Gammaproteobacteria bacterium]
MSSVMKSSLTHLPENKQQELSELASIICEKHDIKMIILFGSYARGDWVEELHDDGFHYKYQSDFDVFIVTETKALANKVESDRQLRDQIRRCVKTPATLIAHDIDFFNRRLRKGQYFFLDIKKEGVCLYNSGRFELAEEKELSPKGYKHLAQEDFDYYFGKANKLNKFVLFACAEKDYNETVFLLHQRTERLYAAILLVLTRYKPNTHDLEKLSGRVASIEPSFLKVFPQGTEEERKLFELLRKGYVDARYNKNYSITAEELAWLVERVNILQDMTQEVCKKKIESLVNITVI